MTEKNTQKKFNLEEAIAWANSGKDKPPVVASQKTSERHDSEFTEPLIFSMDDKEAIAEARKRSCEFERKYKQKQT